MFRFLVPRQQGYPGQLRDAGPGPGAQMDPGEHQVGEICFIANLTDHLIFNNIEMTSRYISVMVFGATLRNPYRIYRHKFKHKLSLCVAQEDCGLHII